MASETPYVLSDIIQKPASDDRDYRFIELPNHMKAVLVSDPSADKAGAAVSVNVGHFSDPEEFPGLAHFLEHMLFMGTEKYPDENEYSAFLASHGGSSNAYTATEHTNYHFDVQAPYLEEALDMFAQFFVKPLFTESGTERELLAVDSEHSKNLQSDMWRTFQLDKSTANPEHPYHKFGTGSKATLWDIPQAAGHNTRKALIKFHEDYYSANVMTLAIVGKQDLDTLEKWAREKFAGVEDKGLQPPAFPGTPFGPEQLGIQQLVVPVKDSHKLDLSFLIPEQISAYRAKPSSYLSHLIGHEGEGSILAALKERGLGLELCAGVSGSESGFAIFGIDIDLTPEGLKRVDEVVDIVFQYIRVLASEGVQDWIFKEVSDIANARFRFMTKQAPLYFTTQLAQSLQNHAPEHVLSGSHLYFEFDKDAVNELLKHFTPQNVRMRVLSQTLSEKCTSEETWYKTSYLETRIDEARLTRWSSAPPSSDLSLPKPNPFIATDFGLRHPVSKPFSALSMDLEHMDLTSKSYCDSLTDHARKIAVIPEPIVLDDSAAVYFAPDEHFGQPKLSCAFMLTCPPAYDSPKGVVLTDLYTQLVKELLNTIAYDASVASMSYRLVNTVDGLNLSFGGFNHRLPVLLAKVIEVMTKPEFTDEQFEMYREQTARRYLNFNLDQPYRCCLSDDACLTSLPRFHNDEKLGPIQSVTPADLRAFVPRLLEAGFIRGYMYGNATVDEAKGLVTTLKGLFPSPLPASLRFRSRVCQAPDGVETRFVSSARNPADENSCIVTTYEFGLVAPREEAMFRLLEHILREPFFDRLRTKQQLGYLVFSGGVTMIGVAKLRFIIQSNKVTCHELDTRIDAFLKEFVDTLKSMEDSEFQDNLTAVIRGYLSVPKKPFDVSSKWNTEVDDGRLRFDLVPTLVAELATISKAELVDFYSAFVSPTGARRRKLSCMMDAGCGVSRLEDAASPARKGISQADGSVLLRRLASSPASLSSTKDRRALLEATLAELGLDSEGLLDEATGMPTVDVTDRSAFRLSLGLYPSVAAPVSFAARATSTTSAGAGGASHSDASPRL